MILKWHENKFIGIFIQCKDNTIKTKYSSLPNFMENHNEEGAIIIEPKYTTNKHSNEVHEF